MYVLELESINKNVGATLAFSRGDEIYLRHTFLQPSFNNFSMSAAWGKNPKNFKELTRYIIYFKQVHIYFLSFYQ